MYIKNIVVERYSERYEKIKQCSILNFNIISKRMITYHGLVNIIQEFANYVIRVSIKHYLATSI